MSTFQEAFEQYAPELLAVAWNYTHRSENLDTLWIYVTVEDKVRIAHAYYGCGGEVLNSAEVGRCVPDIDTSTDAQIDMSTDLSATLRQMIDAAGGEEDFPTRMILRYRVADQDFAAEFSYEPLRKEPEDEDEPDHVFADRWLERLRATGNDSADL